tara:strand:+ start:9049 stop:9501 length:453 start_codon:yes stop_codon:yes gene_type:complete
MELNKFNLKMYKKKKRLGRGIGSSKGKTSGRGHKGQKSRSGVAIKSFEGGQMPLYRRLPKRGFKSFKNKNLAIINISKIENIVKTNKKLSESKINLDTLHKLKIINKKFNMLKILGGGELNSKFDVETNFISSSAKEKIEKLGGKVLLKK